MSLRTKSQNFVTSAILDVRGDDAYGIALLEHQARLGDHVDASRGARAR